jgi:glutathione-independent formaldehyde dehydrogenase
VFVVDAVNARLDKAAELGATPVDFRGGNPVEQIRDLRGRDVCRREWRSCTAPTVRLKAVGYQAKDRSNPEREAAGQVVVDIARLVNPNGRVGIAGV